MSEAVTREQAIKKGKKIQTLQAFVQKVGLLFMSPKKKTLREEIFIETEF